MYIRHKGVDFDMKNTKHERDFMINKTNQETKHQQGKYFII